MEGEKLAYSLSSKLDCLFLRRWMTSSILWWWVFWVLDKAIDKKLSAVVELQGCFFFFLRGV